MKIAITGHPLSGKSLLLSIFRRKGFKTISADEIAHRVLQEKKIPVLSLFGKKILAGKWISRKKLGKIVFADERKRKSLEKIIHPLVIEKTKKTLSKKGNFAFENSLLFEMKMEKLFDTVICVYTTPKKRKMFLKKRGISPSDFRRISHAQLPLKQKMERSDFTVKNDGSVKNLEKQVEKILSKIKNI